MNFWLVCNCSEGSISIDTSLKIGRFFLFIRFYGLRMQKTWILVNLLIIGGNVVDILTILIGNISKCKFLGIIIRDWVL